MKETYRLSNGTCCYLKEETYENHVHELEAATDYLLKHCRNLNSLSINDVSAGGIQIGGCHDSNPGYIMMNATVRYDLSDLDDIVKLFIKKWNSFMENEVTEFKKFTDDGEKYGWD